MLALRVQTDPRWIDVVLADFDSFLIDHAACERKASATGMSFVVRYPDRAKILEPLIAFAREELEHFHQVYRLIEARGITLRADTPDPYVKPLMSAVRTGRDTRFLDRLLLAAVVEARGCERFGIVAEHHPVPEIRTFYQDITRSEARHHGLFVRLAREYFEATEVERALERWLDVEGDIVRGLELRSALH